MRALILAGGRGIRLGKLTDDRPKPMIEIAGRPILEHLIANASRAGISDFTIHLDYLAPKISDHFRDGAKFGVRIHYSHVESPGPENAVLAFGHSIDDDSFCCLCGDTVFTSSQIARLLEIHRATQADGTFVLEPDSAQFEDRVGVPNGFVIGAKTASAASLLSYNMMIRRAFLNALGDATRSRGAQSFTSVLDAVAADYSVRAVDLGPYININNPEQLQAAERSLRLGQENVGQEDNIG